MAKTPSSIPAPPPAPGAAAVTTPAATTPPVAPPPPPTTPPEPTPPPVPTPTPPATTGGGEPQPDQGTAPSTGEPPKAGDPATDDNTAENIAAEQQAQQPNAGGDNENGPVTTQAHKHGAVLASDARPTPEDDDLADIEPTDHKRTDAIRERAFKSGRKGSPLGQRRKSLSDAEWNEYKAAYQRGSAQGDADKLSVTDRLSRIERTLGLPVPGSLIYADDGE